MTEVLVDLDPDIKRAARLVAYQWPGVVEVHDMVQDIYLYLLERPNQVDKLRRTEDDRLRYSWICRIGHQIASQERKEYSYFTGNYRYSVGEVKAILKAGALRWLESDPPVHRALDDEESLSFLTGNTHRLVKLPVDSAITDVRMAMDLLVKRNHRYAAAVIQRYLHEEVPQSTKDRAALKNGLVALAEEMNRVARTNYATRDDGPGTRHPVSAAHAQAITRENWGSSELNWNPA